MKQKALIEATVARVVPSHRGTYYADSAYGGVVILCPESVDCVWPHLIGYNRLRVRVARSRRTGFKTFTWVGPYCGIACYRDQRFPLSGGQTRILRLLGLECGDKFYVNIEPEHGETDE